MKKVFMAGLVAVVLLFVAGRSIAAQLEVDELIVAVNDEDASYAADLLNALQQHSVKIHLEFVITDPEFFYIMQINRSVNAPIDNKILQITYGTESGGLWGKSPGTLVVSEFVGVPGGLVLSITNPEPGELTTLLGAVDPDDVELRFTVVDPDPADAELLIAALGPSNNEIFMSFLLTNPNPLDMLGALIFAGVLPENMRFTTSIGFDF